MAGCLPRGRDMGLKLGLNLLGDFLEISACGSTAGAARAVAQLARPAARRDRRGGALSLLGQPEITHQRAPLWLGRGERRGWGGKPNRFQRGDPTLHLADGTAAFVTIHPSWLLRIEDDANKAREYANFVADLRPAAKVLRKEVA